MLTLDLVRLEKERGPVRIREEVAKDADLFDGFDLPMDSALRVDLTVSPLQHGELMVRGSVTGSVGRECRRCLEPVSVPFEEELDLLFVPDEADGEGIEEDEGVHGYNASAAVLELGAAVREETILAAPLYVECSPDCEGLCPDCGANLNVNDCDCARVERDPRWDALRALTTE